MKKFIRYLINSQKNKEDRILARRIKHILGFYPSNLKLFKISLTHKSTAFIDKDGESYNNERLEFLGDAVLSHVIAKYLYNKFPKFKEGSLTKTRSKIVSGKSLALFSDKIGLSTLIYSDSSIDKIQKKIKEDAFEAFIGAIYLDFGFEHAESFIINRVVNRFLDMEKVIKNDDNFKSQIIEWSQKHHYTVKFHTVATSHQKFKADVLINGDIFGSGIGASKKEAEQEAACEGMKNINHFLE